MSQPKEQSPPTDEEKKLREEEEAADRARGRTPGPGKSPRTDELDVPAADEAPSAPANEG